jgi:NMD protein affecting ribosome stability and mRNA decay
MKRTSTARTLRTIKQPPRKGVAKHEQYGKERPGIIICPDCSNVHYHKRWWDKSDPGLHKLVLVDYRKAARTLCPACKMIEEHLFEGEVVIENVPREFRTELSRLIDNVGRTATEIDPQDRIITALKSSNMWRLTTTENQLADKLAKKIRETFKQRTKVHISHSKEPYEVDRVRVLFNK